MSCTHLRCSLPVIALVLALFQAPLYAHLGGIDSRIPPDGLAVEATWIGLESADDLLPLDKSLTLDIRNHEPIPVLLEADLAIVTDGKVTHHRTPVKRIPAHGDLQLSLPLPRKTGHWQRLRYSGRIQLNLVRRNHGPYRIRPTSGHGGDSVTLPTLYFHPQGRQLLVYRQGVLRERFDAGNFRNLTAGVREPLRDFQAMLKTTGQRVFTPVKALVHRADALPGGLPDDVLPPGSRRFCLIIDGFAYNDSSRPSIDFGEDFGRTGDSIPFSRGWVAVGQQGNPLFTGFLDAEGCTPYVQTSLEEISIAFFPLYRHPDNLIRGFVSDMNLGNQWPDTMPWFLFDFQPVDSPTNRVEMDQEQYIYTIYAAAANALEKVPGGLTDTLYEFRLRADGDNNGTNTNYAAEGHPQVRIKYGSAARSKFTIAHEYGHALLLAPLNPPLDEADLDYSVEAGESDSNHTLTSKEWQLTAAFEGFGHFVAALVWNEATFNADGVYVDGGNQYPGNNQEYPLHVYDRVFESNFDPLQYPDQGVELDWAQFFWNYHTDLFDALLPPSVPTMVNMWRYSYPWPKQMGFYSDFLGGAQVALMFWQPQFEVPIKLGRLIFFAGQAGIDH